MEHYCRDQEFIWNGGTHLKILSENEEVKCEIALTWAPEVKCEMALTWAPEGKRK